MIFRKIFYQKVSLISIAASLLMSLLIVIASLSKAYALDKQDPLFIATMTKGAQIFKRCAACHFIQQEKNKIGPSLSHVFNSKAGSKSKYNYSSAMKQAGENGLIWNQETLKAYLKNPQSLVKGTSMPPIFIDEDEINDLILYLEETSKQ